jgi:hypothetical protein
MESKCEERGECRGTERGRKRREASTAKGGKRTGCQAGGEWTAAEDEYLMAQVALVKNGNWRIVCKRLNKRFSHVRRTGQECKVRFEALPKVSSGTIWTANEDLALLCGCCNGDPNWASISRAIPTHDLHELKRRLQELLHDVAVGAKGGEVEQRGHVTPCERLQVFMSVQLLCEALDNPGHSFEEVRSALDTTHPTQEECLKLLDALETSETRPRWTRRTLTVYIDTVLEKLENTIPMQLQLQSQTQNPNPNQNQTQNQNQNPNLSPDPDLDQVMHRPRAPPETGLPLPLQYWWLPAYIVGYQCYVLALCYVVPPAQP